MPTTAMAAPAGGAHLAPPAIPAGERVDPQALATLAGEVAHRQAAPNTRRAYAAAYRQLAAMLTLQLGRPPRREDLTAEAVRRYRDHLEQAGRDPTTIANRLSAFRQLAAAVRADPACRQVRAQRADPDQPRALDPADYERLLAMPDGRRRAGRRDRAVLLLLGDAGLRRAEAARLDVDDVYPARRQPDGRLRHAIAGGRANQTDWVVRVRHSKRGRTREVPLSRRTLEAIRAWVDVRPAARSPRLLVSLPRGRHHPAQPLSPAAVGDIVKRHAATAGLPTEQRTAHVLRHTFCTALAERDVALEVIAKLAGHADVRTAARYVKVSQDRCHTAIDRTFNPHPPLLASPAAEP